MADISSIRATIAHMMRMAGHFWPRLLALILFPMIFDLLIQLFISNFIPNSSQNATSAYIAIIASLISILVTFVLWSFLLSGWLRHELIPDDTPHPLSAKEHLRALCWHQFCAISVSCLFFAIMLIPLTVFLFYYGIIKTYHPQSLEGVEIYIYICLVILFCIPLFFAMIFYLRYGGGIISLTIYGQKMSMRDAATYRTKHEPAGLTRRYAAYMVCYVFIFALIGAALDVVAQSLLQHEVAYNIISFLITLLLLLFSVACLATLISGYLKQMPTAALNPQKSQS